MDIVIAPDSFKDALRAKAAAKSIACGFRSARTDVWVDECPISDGGEGFWDVLRHQRPASGHEDAATDPLGREIACLWTMLCDEDYQPKAAVFELAMASGLERLELAERNPTRTTTFGTGVLIRAALKEGAKQILLGIGGSATNDAACGIAQALGVRFLDANDNLLPDSITGGMLKRIAQIDISGVEPRLNGLAFQVACDVTNPLTGPNGAAHVYAPQKGATPEQVEELDAGLRHMAKLWRDQLGVDVEQMPGAGAAGGVGGGLVAMLGAELVPGAELVLDTIGFDERIKDADLVVTGEGRLDSQSLQGKAAMTVAKRCQRAGVPCVALVGSVGEGAEEALNRGLSAYHVIGEGLPAEESIRRTGELLEQAAVKLAQDRLLN